MTLNLATGAEFGINNNNTLGMRLGPPGIAFYAANTSPGAGVAGIYMDATGDLNYNVATGDVHDFRVNNVNEVSIGATGITFDTAHSQSAAGNTIPNIYYNSTGFHYNVPNDDFHEFHENGTAFFRLSGDYGLLMDGSSQTFHTSLRSIYADTSGYLKVNCSSSTASVLCAEGGGTTLPEVAVHGTTETAYAGAIEIKAGAVTLTNDGTWRNLFSLAKGIYVGNIWIQGRYDASNPLYWSWWEIHDATLNLYYNSPNNVIAMVVAGSAGVSNIALRISGGYLQYNCGTSVGAGTKLSVTFQGTVV
jgi:hypothetical protein